MKKYYVNHECKCGYVSSSEVSEKEFDKELIAYSDGFDSYFHETCDEEVITCYVNSCKSCCKSCQEETLADLAQTD